MTRRLDDAPLEVGPYSLRKKIGEGGMGEVWRTEQREPVRRAVAWKIIKRGMETDQIVARFRLRHGIRDLLVRVLRLPHPLLPSKEENQRGY